MTAADAAAPAVDPAATIAALLADAAGHTADALPELLILARGGIHFETRLRPYLGEVIHCLSSALEAALIASADAQAAFGSMPKRAGEGVLAETVRAYLDETLS